MRFSRRNELVIRKAQLRDAPALFRMIHYYAEARLLLPRPLEDLAENIGDFVVAETGGQVVGCGALKFYNRELAEIRSLCVAPESKSRGVGRALTERLLRKAAQCRVKTVFALTNAPQFFEKCGFREVERESFPAKIRQDCFHCELHLHCRERTMAIEVPALAARPRSAASPAVAQVPA